MPDKTERLRRIDELIEKLTGLTDVDAIALLGQQEHDWLYAHYKASSAGTFISAEYVPAIMQAFPPSQGDELAPTEWWQMVNGQRVKRHLVIKTLKPTLSEWDERNLPTKVNAATKADGKLPLYPDSIILRAESLLKSNHWADLAAGAIALTGRRPTEVVWSGRFELDSDYTLVFSGQLKKGKIETLPFPIPTLIPAQKVLQALARLQQMEKIQQLRTLDTPRAASDKSNKLINDAVRRHFTGLLQSPFRTDGSSRLSATDLRAAYGKIATYFYCPPTAEPIFYCGKILGHQTDNYQAEALATTIHYFSYFIAGSDGAPVGDLGIRLERGGVKPLYADAHARPLPMPPEQLEPEQIATDAPSSEQLSSKKADDKDKVSQIRIRSSDIARFHQIAKRLDFQGNQADKLGLLLDWSEQRLNLEEVSSLPTEDARSSGLVEPRPEPLGEPVLEQTQPSSISPSIPQVQSQSTSTSSSIPQLQPQSTSEVDKAMAAIAQLSETMAPLLMTMTRLVERLETQPTPLVASASAATRQRGSASSSRSQKELPSDSSQPKSKRQQRDEEEDALVNAKVDQIIEYNASRPHDQKWAISINGLKQLLSCSQQRIVRIFQERHLEQYNADNDLGRYHNKRHRQNIEEVFGRG